MDMRRCSIEFITLIPVEKVAAAAVRLRWWRTLANLLK